MMKKVKNYGESSCLYCEVVFARRASVQKFCSDYCRIQFEKTIPKALNTQTMSSRSRVCEQGAINELVAAIYLMQKGWQVFRAFSPSATCDLVAIRESEIVRVQVKTVYLNKEENFFSPKFSNEDGRFDVLAKVTPDGSRIEFVLPNGELWDSFKEPDEVNTLAA